MNPTDTHKKLTRIRVEGLLDRFVYEIHFDPDWHFLILHGPNGVGKTRLLELVHSAFSGKYFHLLNIPFDYSLFEFDDGSYIEVAPQPIPRQEVLPTLEPDHKREPQAAQGLNWELSIPHQKTISYAMQPELTLKDRRYISRIAHRFPVERLESNLWLDLTTNEHLDTYELAERYGFSVSTSSVPPDMPDALVEYLDNYKIHLIETQRLLTLNQQFGRHRRSPLDPLPQQPTVVAYSNDLRQRLDTALARNTLISQPLDRSFPGRLFQEGTNPESEGHLRRRYAEQLQLRSRLVEIALLDSSDDLPLPNDPLSDWQRRVLQIYLDDTDKKLAMFQSLLTRLELMRDIINGKFLFKRLHFDRELGMVFTDQDSDARVDLQHLSSGEQHEIVLLCDLIMNVSEHSLVLIDEPEISLHATWQKSFLSDLDRIASLRTLRFVVATHSPLIIDKWWSRSVGLGSIE